MTRQFFKYIGCVLSVLTGVAVVDKVAGAGMNRLLNAVPVTQDIGKGRFAINEVKSDVKIVGSSRASHHYVSALMADSLGCSVYNVGRDGCFFSDNLCVANSILERYSPKLLVLDVLDDYLYKESMTRPEALFPYYWKSEYIRKVVDFDRGWKAHVQMLSTLYRYNSTSFRTIGYGLKGLKSGYTRDPRLGYNPLPYVERRSPLKNESGEKPKKEEIVISERKRDLMKELLEKAADKNVKVVIVCSPFFQERPNDNPGKIELKALCVETGAEYSDYSVSPLFGEHPEWFYDMTHLNCYGAEEYTRMFIKLIKDHKLLCNNPFD